MEPVRLCGTDYIMGDSEAIPSAPPLSSIVNAVRRKGFASETDTRCLEIFLEIVEGWLQRGLSPDLLILRHEKNRYSIVKSLESIIEAPSRVGYRPPLGIRSKLASIATRIKDKQSPAYFETVKVFLLSGEEEKVPEDEGVLQRLCRHSASADDELLGKIPVHAAASEVEIQPPRWLPLRELSYGDPFANMRQLAENFASFSNEGMAHRLVRALGCEVQGKQAHRAQFSAYRERVLDHVKHLPIVEQFSLLELSQNGTCFLSNEQEKQSLAESALLPIILESLQDGKKQTELKSYLAKQRSELREAMVRKFFDKTLAPV